MYPEVFYSIVSIVVTIYYRTHTTTLFLLLLSTVLIYLKLSNKKLPNYPPGPMILPIFGSSILFWKLIRKHGNIGTALQQLSKEYKSTLVGINLGCERLVIAFGQSAYDVLINRDCEGRSDNFFMRQRTMGVRKGITGVDGHLWEEHRKFLLRKLANFGYGKSSMDNQISDMADDIIDTLFKSETTKVYLAPLISLGILNVLWLFVSGEKVSDHKGRIEKLLHLLEERSRVFDMSGGVLNQFPWIRFIAPEKSGYTLINQVNKEMRDFLTQIIEEHKGKTNKKNDIISEYLNEIENARENSTFDEEQLMMVCLDLFIAGSHTTSSFMNVAFYIMLLHPEVQEKIHQEIDRNVGKRKISFSDTKLLPFTTATINEIQRLYCIFPIIGPRRTLKDVQIDKYTIPKDTTILISVQSVHMDSDVWENPDLFLPDRFLDKNEKVINTHKNLTFGTGRRRCLAEELAKHFIFVIFVSVLQNFYVRKADDCVLRRAFENGIFIQPKPFPVNLHPK